MDNNALQTTKPWQSNKNDFQLALACKYTESQQTRYKVEKTKYKYMTGIVIIIKE